MLERDIVKDILRNLNSYEGVLAWKIHGNPMQTRGLPDVLGLIRGYFFGLEVKVPGKEHTLTAIQAATLRHIAEAGGISAMVTSVEEARKVVMLGWRERRNAPK
jgi:hypothetical protein